MNYRSILMATVQTVGLFISGFFIPVLGQILTPAPLILVYVRNGRLDGLTALGISSLVVAVLAGWYVAAVLLFCFGLMAVGSAEAMRRQWKPESAALLGGLPPVAVLGVVTAYYFSRINKNPATVIETFIQGQRALAAKLYAGLGLNELAAAVSSVSDTSIHYFVQLLPGMTVAALVFTAACSYAIARAIIIRKPGAGPKIVPTSFAAWHAPDTWIWGLIATLALVVVPQETARTAGWNLAILFVVVYLAQGSAIIEHFLRKTRMGPVMRGLVLSLILALPSMVFVIALGVVDIWADFRKVRGPVQAA